MMWRWVRRWVQPGGWWVGYTAFVARPGYYEMVEAPFQIAVDCHYDLGGEGGGA